MVISGYVFALAYLGSKNSGGIRFAGIGNIENKYNMAIMYFVFFKVIFVLKYMLRRYINKPLYIEISV